MLLQPKNDWPSGSRRAATKQDSHLFFSTIKMTVKLWPYWHGWQNFKATDCLVLVALSAFFHLRGTEILPEILMECPLDFSEKVFIKRGLITWLLSPLQNLYVQAGYSGLANVMHQNSYEVCSRPWKQNGQLESWSPCGIQWSTWKHDTAAHIEISAFSPFHSSESE